MITSVAVVVPVRASAFVAPRDSQTDVRALVVAHPVHSFVISQSEFTTQYPVNRRRARLTVTRV